MTIKFPIQRFTVHGNSMLPILKPGQDVLVLCWFFKLQVGDIVAIKVNDREMIKRIGQITSDPPAGEAGRNIFVQGDNERMSTDSRKFGPIQREQIIGKVIWY